MGLEETPTFHATSSSPHLLAPHELVGFEEEDTMQGRKCQTCKVEDRSRTPLPFPSTTKGQGRLLSRVSLTKYLSNSYRRARSTCSRSWKRSWPSTRQTSSPVLYFPNARRDGAATNCQWQAPNEHVYRGDRNFDHNNYSQDFDCKELPKSFFQAFRL